MKEELFVDDKAFFFQGLDFISFNLSSMHHFHTFSI
jgi:hypothetical protein